MSIPFEEARSLYLPRVQAALEASAGVAGHLELMVQQHLATGGKRLRAIIPPWVAANLGGDVEAAVSLGVGLELLHNGTLVHDDLQDGDAVRRGHPTVWRRWGEAQAINAGDGFYFQGFASILSVGGAHTAGRRIARALERVVEGQVMEFQLQAAPGSAERLAPTLDNWVRMAGGKTGALMGACVMAGAWSAGRDDEALDDAASWGEQLGLLFQVQDDVLDLIGGKGREMVGTDLAEGKLSFPVVWFLEHVSGSARQELIRIVQTPRAQTTAEEVSHGLALLNEAGALEAALQWLREARETSVSSPWSNAAPGLADAFLAPIRGAL
jgi:geranylgeranyl diphosphate synthase type I